MRSPQWSERIAPRNTPSLVPAACAGSAKASEPAKWLIVKSIPRQLAHAKVSGPGDAVWQTADLQFDGRPGCIESAVPTMIVAPILYIARHRISSGWSTLSLAPEPGQFEAAASVCRRRYYIGRPSMRPSPLREFLKLDAAGEFVLLRAPVLTLILANSPLASFYDGLLGTPVAVRLGARVVAKLMLVRINDGLLAVFFQLVGLEIKRELVEWELSHWSRAALPSVTA